MNPKQTKYSSRMRTPTFVVWGGGVYPTPTIPYPYPPPPDILLPGSDMGPEIPYPTLCEQIDRSLWKHYLPKTTVAGDNNADSNSARKFISRETNSHISNGMTYLNFQIATGLDFRVWKIHGHQCTLLSNIRMRQWFYNCSIQFRFTQVHSFVNRRLRCLNLQE